MVIRKKNYYHLQLIINNILMSMKIRKDLKRNQLKQNYYQRPSKRELNVYFNIKFKYYNRNKMKFNHKLNLS